MIVMVTALAGGLGAVARFLIDSASKARWPSTIPWSTIGINISGCLLIGLVAGAVRFHTAAPELLTVLGTGFCGGYTTLSTASYETVRLIEQHAHRAALANIFLTLGVSWAACATGLAIAYLV